MGKTRCINCMQMIDEATAFCPHCGFGQKENEIPFGIKPGTILRGRYLVGRVLGQGGFGLTYVGYDLTLEIKIAIKEYFPSGSVTRNHTISNHVQWNSVQFDREQWQAGCESFLKEARRMAKLTSLPGIVRVLDTFPENQTAYIIMDFVEGETLKQKLMKTGPMKYTECLQMLRPLMESLGKMHGQGLVHRDISPDNIMVQPDGSVCLLDFGAAKDVSFQQTAASQQIAKRGFSPPEQYSEIGSIGSWTDVYALCATIYYCITGKLVPDALDRLYEDTLDFDMFLAEPLSEMTVNTLKDGLKLRSEKRIRTVEELLGRFDGTSESGKRMDPGSPAGTVPENKEAPDSVPQSQDIEQDTVREPQQEEQDTVREPQQEEQDTVREPQRDEQDTFSETQQNAAQEIQQNIVMEPQQDSIREAEQNTSGEAQQSDINLQYPDHGNGEQPGTKSEKKKINKKIVGISAAVVVGLLVLIGVMSGSDKKETIRQAESEPLITEKQSQDSEIAESEENAEQPQDREETEVEEDAEKILAAEEPEKIAGTNILMEDDSWEYSDGQYYGTVLGSEINRESIVTVTFVDTLEAMGDNAWDVSKEQNSTVIAWTEPHGSNDQELDLFIGAEGKIGAENCAGLFKGYNNVETIEFNNCFDTSQVTDMNDMFAICQSLTQLDVSGFDTSQVTNMEGMFDGCIRLTQLDLSNFDTSQVTDMSWMFYDCCSLTQLDVSGFDTSQVTDMWGMFHMCEDLTQLDVSGFDTSQVTDMSGMFAGGSSLTQLDVSGFDTSQVTNMSDMFYDCLSLTQLDVSGFDTSQVTNMSDMFYGCWSLTQLDVSGFDTSQVTDMSGMFYFCYSLKQLDVSGFDTSQVTKMSDMFYDCWSLTQLDVSGFDTSQVTDMNRMFAGCSSLTQLDVSNFNTSQVTSMNEMFDGCAITAEEAGLKTN